MLSDASAADSFFENIVSKEEIAQNVQFLLLPQCFPLFVICQNASKSWKGLNDFIINAKLLKLNPFPQCFPLLVIAYPFNYGDFLCFDKIRSKSSAAELSYQGKG